MNDEMLVALGRQYINSCVEKENLIRRMMHLESENLALKSAGVGAAPPNGDQAKPGEPPKLTDKKKSDVSPVN